MGNGPDWQAVGRAVAMRRVELEIRSQAEAADAAKINPATWRLIEDGTPGNYRAVTLAAIAMSLGWPADTLERIAAGEAPPHPPTSDDVNRRLERLEADVQALTALVERLRRRPGG